MGASEDAAQKRVSRAVERLREFLSKRNLPIGAAGLTVLISANAVQSAPVGLAVTISAAAVHAGTTVHSTVIAATKVIAMTTLQKTIIGVALATTIGAGIFEAHHYLLRATPWKLRQPLNSNEFQNVGRGTPEAAAETVLWAAFNKPSELGDMVLLPPDVTTEDKRKTVGEELAKAIVEGIELIQGPSHQVWLDGGAETVNLNSGRMPNGKTYQYNGVFECNLAGRPNANDPKEYYNFMYFIKIDGQWKLVFPGFSPEIK